MATYCTKVRTFYRGWHCADYNSSGGDAKIKWRHNLEELEVTGPAFQPRWMEFFLNHLDKAIAISSIFSVCVPFTLI
jgi:hypothetical protein